MRWHQCSSRFVRVFLGPLFSSTKQIKFSYVFDGEHRSALHEMQGNRASYRGEGKSHGFLKLPREPVEYFWVMVGKNLHRSCLFSTLELLSIYKVHLRNLLKALKGNSDASQCEVGYEGSLSTCHSDIGIRINFQEESGIITFWSIELRVHLQVSKWCEASSPDETGS